MSGAEEEAERAQAPTAPRRKRKRKRAQPADAPKPEPAPKVTAPVPASRGMSVGVGLAAVVLAFIYMRRLAPSALDYALVALGVAGFALGASAPDPRRAVPLAGGAAALGLALTATRPTGALASLLGALATQPSDVGVVLAMGGGLALAGAIHSLGRLGPA